MNRRLTLACLLSLALAFTVRAANWPEHPTLHAVRATSALSIDGDLSDAAWQSAPEFTGFTQHDPVDGEPATMPTSIRIVYDDEAIYFGAKMTDPGKVSTQLARRDSFTQSDFISFNLDPTFDRLSGSAFSLNPANVQVDSILFSDIGEDKSWDGVWTSATKIVSGGWIAEVRIPFSQLRFPDRPVHTWGLNITRRTLRNNELVRIVNTKKGDTGFVSHFADIEGLEGIRRGRPLELVPYAVAREDVQTRADRSNPFVDRSEMRADAGLDLKYALTSSLTLTGTINPDFGQVEVDPAVVNLSQFETFYPEKRPFFTEGSNLFRFNDTPASSHFNFIFSPSLFYTRRIGRAPQGRPDADFADSPADTTILGAVKVTGKLPGGWSLGILDALTDTERARTFDGSGFGREQVEPMTNYFVSRISKQMGAGSRVGFMLTSVNRKLPDELSFLRESAVTGGVDGYTTLRRKWTLEGSLVGSSVTGSTTAIGLTQRLSSRYYQRPDAGHVEFDPSRTSLSGFGGRAMISTSSGTWRPNVQVQAYSPGYETNDSGFMRRTDIISAHAMMQNVNEKTTKRFRKRVLWLGTWQNRNFDGDTVERGIFADAFGTLQSYWEYRGSLFLNPGAMSDRLARGGPLVRTPFGWSSDLSLESDDRKKFSYGWFAHIEGADDSSYDRTGGMNLSFRPLSNLSMSVSPSYSRSHDHTQYISRFADATATRTYGQRYLFADLEQRSFELATRADWTPNSRLSLQLYLQPFVAAGEFHDYHTLDAARTRDFSAYAAPVSSNDFNLRSIRGSAVARWEFRPGSALYVVWNENRADVAPVGDLRFGRDLRAIPNAPSHDVLLIKFSYWLPL